MTEKMLQLYHRNKKYHKRLSSTINTNKLYSLEEMDTFLKIYNLPRLTMKKKYLNRFITTMKIGSVIKTPQQESSRLDGYIGELYQTF